MRTGSLNCRTNGPTIERQIASWQVVRLELVSLLRYSEPRVYVAATMPAMDQLATVPHRALNEFERGALPSLESRQDVVVDKQVGKNRHARRGSCRHHLP